jgi:hypothetical protein
MTELVGPVFGAILTLLILSYLIGENPLYRIGLHIFVGLLVGYALGIVVREVLLAMALPRLIANPSAAVVPVVLGILLLFKGFPKQAFIGNFPMAYLVGVGAAVAIGGAVLGTLGPQVAATGRALSADAWAGFRFGLLDGLMIVVGTISTLLAFSFTRVKREPNGLPWQRILAGIASVGRVFLIVAFGVAFAAAVTAFLSIFIGRMDFLIDLVVQVTGL